MRSDIQKRIETASEKQIDLRNLKITDQELSEIILQIKKRWPTSERQIESILLSNNNITDKGAETLSKELPSFKNLSFLDLQNNQINKEGIVALLTLKSTRDKASPKLEFAFYGNLYSNVGELNKMEKKIENAENKILKI